MYLAVVTFVAGEGPPLLWPVPLLDAAAVWPTVAAFVRWYEEPTPRAAPGEEYEASRRAAHA